MNIGVTLWEKLKENPLKIIGRALTCLGLAFFLLSIETSIDVFFGAALILVVIGPIVLIISWIVNKEFTKQSFKLIFIGGFWFLLSIFGIGFWLANIMIYTSLILITLGIIVPIIGLIINKINEKQ